MPTLVYFGIQGRAQSIRYLLAYKQVAFEDKRLSFEEWGPAKAAGTYGAGNSVPVWVEDDGTVKNQGNAILHYLAHKHGLNCATAEEQYELNWFYETGNDHQKPEFMKALFNADADQATIDGFVAEMNKNADKLEARFADGRAHVTGANISAADFSLLAGHTGVISNSHLRCPSISERLMADTASRPNLARVLANIQSECQATVDAIVPGWI